MTNARQNFNLRVKFTHIKFETDRFVIGEIFTIMNDTCTFNPVKYGLTYDKMIDDGIACSTIFYTTIGVINYVNSLIRHDPSNFKIQCIKIVLDSFCKLGLSLKVAIKIADQ